MKNWMVASYKTKELRSLESNLQNQEFEYYIPKIFFLNTNSIVKEELLFPGYVFIHSNLENYSAIQYTRGIKNIIKFGNNPSFVEEDEILTIKEIEKNSKIKPLKKIFNIGEEAFIKNGSLKGRMVEICSLPFKKRVDIFLYILGEKRRVNMLVNDLSWI